MKIFLDTNWLIDIFTRDTTKIQTLKDHQVFISPLSVHIMFYVYNLKVPQPHFQEIFKTLNIVALTPEILEKALLGPTKDLEDNIQLQSAVSAGCNFFLTGDKNLLKLGVFGSTEIKEKIN